MKNSLPKSLGLLCVLCLSSFGWAAIPEDQPKVAVSAPEAVVREFLKCIPGQQVDAMRTMLANTPELSYCTG